MRNKKNIILTFLFLHENICCAYSLEVPSGLKKASYQELWYSFAFRCSAWCVNGRFHEWSCSLGSWQLWFSRYRLWEGKFSVSAGMASSKGWNKSCDHSDSVLHSYGHSHFECLSTFKITSISSLCSVIDPDKREYPHSLVPLYSVTCTCRRMLYRLDPFMPSGLPYLNFYDRFISNRRDV